MCVQFDLYVVLNTSSGEGLRITRPGGGAYSDPLLSRLPETLETRNLGGVSPHNNSLWCKFGEPSSSSSRSNDVINAKFSDFLVKRAVLCSLL